MKSSGIIVNDQQANPFTAMKSFSAACKRLRRVASPFVFQGIRIGHDWEWDRVARAFTEILQNSLVAKYARTFVLATSAVYQEHVSSPWGLIPCQDKSTEPTADIALAFGDVLRKMTRLDVLVLALTSIASRNLFEEHVPKTALKQLSIKRITLGQMMGHGICHQCPQLQVSISRRLLALLASSCFVATLVCAHGIFSKLLRMCHLQVVMLTQGSIYSSLHILRRWI